MAAKKGAGPKAFTMPPGMAKRTANTGKALPKGIAKKFSTDTTVSAAATTRSRSPAPRRSTATRTLGPKPVVRTRAPAPRRSTATKKLTRGY